MARTLRNALAAGSQHSVEHKFLYERVEELDKRLKEVQEERDTTNRIAEDLYRFFSRTGLGEERWTGEIRQSKGPL